MPERVVWELYLPMWSEEQQQIARRCFSDLRSDPHVASVQFLDFGEHPSATVLVEFLPGYDQPAHHELHGLNLRYPMYGVPGILVGASCYNSASTLTIPFDVAAFELREPTTWHDKLLKEDPF